MQRTKHKRANSRKTMIPLDIPQFQTGNEKRFADFIASLDKKDKIILISHAGDLDGLGSTKIIGFVIPPDFIKFIDYEEINEDLIKEIKKTKAKKVIFSDLNFKTPEVIKKLEKFASILIIDHHLVTEDYNSEKTVFLNAQGFCATYLSYYLFSKIQNLEKLDWLAVSASISDWMFSKNIQFMTQTFKKYNQNFIGTPEGITNNSFWDLQDKLSLALIYFKEKNLMDFYNLLGKVDFNNRKALEPYAKEVQLEIDKTIEKFEKEKEPISDGYFFELTDTKYRTKSIVINILSHKYQDKTFVIIHKQKDLYIISGRRQDGKVDIQNFLRKLISGFENSDAGGHFKASGGYFPIKYYEELKKRVKNL